MDRKSRERIKIYETAFAVLVRVNTVLTGTPEACVLTVSFQESTRNSDMYLWKRKVFEILCPVVSAQERFQKICLNFGKSHKISRCMQRFVSLFPPAHRRFRYKLLIVREFSWKSRGGRERKGEKTIPSLIGLH